jgi:hypothetical protein
MTPKQPRPLPIPNPPNPPPGAPHLLLAHKPLPPLPNYSLSSVCPACNRTTIRRACKVRCEGCGFVWDCSEL